MENANKALIMSASVLLAVMLFAVFVMFIKNIAVLPESQDELLSTEQKAKFNTEYEVYYKKAMYGVDVVSCLNKAKSNNEKYVTGDNFLTGDEYGNLYIIDVFVKINKPLTESLRVYYINAQNKEVEKFTGDSGSVTMGNLDPGNSSTKVKFENLPSSSGANRYYTKFYTGTKLVDQSNDLTDSSKYMIQNGGTYSLNQDGISSSGYYSLRNDKQLQNILLYSNNMNQSLTNTTGKNLDIWSTVTWETALYDFKKKRFKCDYMEYSGKTGLINKIYFSEI